MTQAPPPPPPPPVRETGPDHACYHGDLVCYKCGNFIGWRRLFCANALCAQCDKLRYTATRDKTELLRAK